MELLEIQAGESISREPLSINMGHIVMVRLKENGRSTIEFTGGDEFDVLIEYATLVKRLKGITFNAT